MGIEILSGVRLKGAEIMQTNAIREEAQVSFQGRYTGKE